MKNRVVFLLKYFIIALIIALIVCDIKAVNLIDQYITRHAGDQINRSVMIVCDYLLSVTGYCVLYSLLKLTDAVIKDKVFTNIVVRYIIAMEIACIAAAIIAFVGGLFYNVYFLIALVALFIALIVGTLRHVFHSAIDIKEEMDLVV